MGEGDELPQSTSASVCACGLNLCCNEQSHCLLVLLAFAGAAGTLDAGWWMVDGGWAPLDASGPLFSTAPLFAYWCPASRFLLWLARMLLVILLAMVNPARRPLLERHSILASKQCHQHRIEKVFSKCARTPLSFLSHILTSTTRPRSLPLSR